MNGCLKVVLYCGGCNYMFYSCIYIRIGLYVSDIAEVRHGCNSYVFRHVASMNTTDKTPSIALNPSLCMTIIGSERTIDVMVSSPMNQLILTYVSAYV